MTTTSSMLLSLRLHYLPLLHHPTTSCGFNSIPPFSRIPRRCCHGVRQQEQISSASEAAANSPLQRRQRWHSNRSTIIISNHPSASSVTLLPSRRSFHSSLASLLRQPKHNILSALSCPYKTLQIPKDSTYAHAKKSFLKIAMKHHPDTMVQNNTTTNIDQTTKLKSQEIFMKCRQALESLVECQETGRAILRTNLESSSSSRNNHQQQQNNHSMSNEEFDTWFEKETGHSSNPFQFDLDPKVMREVADMHTSMEGSHGLDRDGGMWHLASMISNAVKSGKENGGAESILRLEAGNITGGGGVEEDAMGKLERRRKKEKKTAAMRMTRNK